MDKFPLLLDGVPSGELTAEREALYTWFTARCPLPAEEGALWCAWAVGDRGELRLGVLEPQGEGGGPGMIRRRFSRQMTAPLGRVLRGEARPAGQREPERWENAAAPERLFRAAWLRQRLRGVQPGLTRKTGDGVRELALPYDAKKPFPLTALFCFARVRSIGEGRWAVFRFDSEEHPVF